VLFSLISCNHIETGDTLKESDIKYIRNLRLLDSDEKIYKFYAEFKKDRAGNFFTNKRITTYWIDIRYKEKNEVSFAFYPEIKSIDTVFDAGKTYLPYLLITKSDNTQFKVVVNGKKDAIKSFFEEALKLWSKNRK
jgi:hypothetical protein